MKKFFSSFMFCICLMSSSFCSAKDVWVYEYPNGNSLYIVYESVVYGYRTGFYAYFRIKHVDEYGNLIRTEKWEMNRDEGDWCYGIYNPNDNKRIEDSRRVYDYEDATEVLNWLKAHENEAKRTADPIRRVLGD